MNAEEYIKSGDLDSALTALQNVVRDDPSAARERIFLFQLLAVRGDWNRALTQLNVAAELDNEALLMAQTCRELIQCEGFRTEVFRGKRHPLLFGEPAQWLVTLLQALPLADAANGESAAKVSAEAFEAAPLSAGKINDEPFLWIADADMRLGPSLEAVINGKYYWVPFSNVQKIELHAPADLRDLVWVPVEFTWRNEGQAVGFIPARYPGSTNDHQLALSRRTDWQDVGGDFFIGRGQRMWSTDSGDYSILETRTIEFTTDNKDDSASASDAC